MGIVYHYLHKELGIGNYVIVSIDKDLRTVGGYYWSYYRERVKDMQGEFILNEYGNYETDFKHKEVEFITPKQAELILYIQLLVGDNSDNVKGVKGIGKVRAEKLLETSKNPFITVARQYIEKSTKENFRINKRLLTLGN